MVEKTIINLRKNSDGDMDKKIGCICFANYSGLGMQTRRLAKMLNPDRILIVDSSSFSKNREQHFEWYEDYDYFVSNGFPSNSDVHSFLQNLTHVFTAENPYNFNLVWFGQKQGTKIYCQSNYEFCENLDKPYLPVLDKFLMPSFWKIDRMEKLFGKDRVMYLPPPIDPKEFKKARVKNMKRKNKKKRFLHILGTEAMMDRNGTDDLIKSIALAKEDFKLVIKTQHHISMDKFLDDPRVEYVMDNIKDPNDLYEDFDALLLPRRWGGLSLTTNEALMCGMPVLMTDISPNSQLLPKEWLVKSKMIGMFMARSPLAYYSVDHKAYAKKIDEFAKKDLTKDKVKAYNLGELSFSPKRLKPKYLELMNT